MRHYQNNSQTITRTLAIYFMSESLNWHLFRRIHLTTTIWTPEIELRSSIYHPPTTTVSADENREWSDEKKNNTD
ncbi:hypothetical protein J2753_001488 [Halolamina salifodinae]|uniref:Uncharacterized protein n=1 Tax=Halolamina salifodinae TaxID=1202767 RepID=A0A8T4GX01_9EURY|nr:hypothetical protein [Halolamina salifodinae]